MEHVRKENCWGEEEEGGGGGEKFLHILKSVLQIRLAITTDRATQPLDRAYVTLDGWMQVAMRVHRITMADRANNVTQLIFLMT